VTQRERIVLVGPGRAGCGLARGFTRAGTNSSRSWAVHRRIDAWLVAALGDVPVVPHSAALGLATLVIIAVPDDRLIGVAAALAEGTAAAPTTLGLPCLRREGALRSRTARGPRRAYRRLAPSAKPPRCATPGRPGLDGVLVAIESGMRRMLQRLESLARAVNGRPAEPRAGVVATPTTRGPRPRGTASSPCSISGCALSCGRGSPKNSRARFGHPRRRRRGERRP
jgi:hypothetical protein